MICSAVSEKLWHAPELIDHQIYSYLVTVKCLLQDLDLEIHLNRQNKSEIVCCLNFIVKSSRKQRAGHLLVRPSKYRIHQVYGQCAFQE